MKFRNKLRRFILGATEMHELPAEEVDQLLTEYTSEDITKELFEFGQMLLTADDDRVGLINSKATTLVWYSSAILAFLLLRGVTGSYSWLELGGIAIAGVLAGVACAYAALSIYGAQNWKQLSEATWFPRDRVLAGSDSLKRYYISAMHQVLQDNRRIANRKADQMITAQVLVSIIGVILVIIVACASISTIFLKRV